MGKRLSPEQWASIKRRYVNDGESAKILAREFGISASAIYKRSQRNDPAVTALCPNRRPGDSIADTVSRLERLAERFETVLARGRRGE